MKITAQVAFAVANLKSDELTAIFDGKKVSLCIREQGPELPNVEEVVSSCSVVGRVGP